ncbi:hypothetical protein Cni_G05878 [Canna indica]|uniref:SHSP domain-containing protein n=1 Tax=Canna indica TaxID=4628 RepID=A0AAQ3Q3K7_9LILI|nr:hypothetical protein Cni_G05878 [Canna indica]
MENADLTVRRRVGRILDHVAGSSSSDEALPPSSLLLPLHCSSTLSTLVQRRDNMLFFARQGSNSRGRFMQEISSNNQETAATCNGSSDQKILPNCYVLQCGEEPLFSRKAKCGDIISSPPTSTRIGSTMKQDAAFASNDAPLFARKLSCSRKVNQKQQLNYDNMKSKMNAGMEWSPRMDVAESRQRYVLTLELPGVRSTDIQVEVDNERLTIMGKRSVRQGKLANGREGMKANYHQREISEGPYRVVWPLPRDVNKDAVSAELMSRWGTRAVCQGGGRRCWGRSSSIRAFLLLPSSALSAFLLIALIVYCAGSVLDRKLQRKWGRACGRDCRGQRPLHCPREILLIASLWQNRTSKHQFISYMESYASAYGIRPQFGTEVTAAEFDRTIGV